MPESRLEHGFPREQWRAAIAEVREFLVDCARSGAKPLPTIFEVSKAVTSLERDGPYAPLTKATVRRLLRDVDASEIAQGNVRLSALVQETRATDLAWTGRTRRQGMYLEPAERLWLDEVSGAVAFWSKH